MPGAENLSRQSGFSLIELTVATALSLMVLSLLVHLLMAGKQAALSRSLQLILAQDVQDAWRMLSGDVRRAGFQTAESGTPLLPPGAVHTVHVTAGHCLVMSYELEGRTVVKAYYRQDGELRVRSSHDTFSTPDQACQGGQALLDSRWMTVTGWQVQYDTSPAAGIPGQLLSVRLSVSSLDSSAQLNETMALRVRNP
ncbi:prepilin-type N-terminal cleavage/methylation domain-containing protein [Photobacterium sp. WH24]|uniref:prepilin-type N-terminal cleavage/methylation domain-containing protein n=1 Tax=Photobacterium sp. WH24 TaxID=2827237 RepID=UPI001C44E3F2|nr:prepilin-type N-terminal cleavage/methylation domain-containing protein [Photobacterium sp. WH24]MBV7260465.1 prepilin-type N-terminal cleavage/methylation domain-containing protein [Photobacterium sp. WH24]